MLTIFNRKELLSTFDTKRQSEIRGLLAQNGIDYTVKTVNRKSSSPIAAGSRARTGTLGENLGAEYEYTIYIHKSDYEKAAAILNGRQGQ